MELGVEMKLTPTYILHRFAIVVTGPDVLRSLASYLLRCLSDKLDPE